MDEVFGYALIGSEIDVSMIYSTHVALACGCKTEVRPNHHYCPICGMELARTMVPINGYDENERMLQGFKVIITGHKNLRYFLGYGTRCDNQYDNAIMMPIDDILKMKQQLKTLFEMLGVHWNENKFGLWAISRTESGVIGE